jgi:predicted PurR-regulated permease PerM
MSNRSVPLDSHRLMRVLVVTIVTTAIVLTLVWAKSLLIPISIAILFTCILSPIVRYFRRRHVGPVVSVFIAMGIAGLLIGLTSWLVTREFSAVVAEFPEYSHSIREKVRALKKVGSGKLLQRYDSMIREVANEIHPPVPVDRSQSVQSWWGSVLNREAPPAADEPQLPQIPWAVLTGYLGSAADVLGMVAFTIVLTVFFLLGQSDLRDRISLLAGRSNLATTSYALSEASEKISRYLGTVALLNTAFGLILMAGLYLLNVPFAFLAGFLAGSLRFIPYLGPCFGGAFPLILSLASSDGWTQPLSVFALVVVLELICNNVVEPILFGQSTGVSPTALVISAAFWLLVWGPIGLILSAPISVCLVVLGQYVRQLRVLTLILGENPPLEPQLQLYQRLVLNDGPEVSRIVQQYSTSHTLQELFDQLFVPVLILARRDHGKGTLLTENYDRIVTQLTELTHESARAYHDQNVKEQAVTSQTDDHSHLTELLGQSDRSRLTLLACPALDQVDEAAIHMLRGLLPERHWSLEMTTSHVLASEVIARLEESPPDVIFISSVSPLGISQVIYLCKRLRAAAPEIPIVVGRFTRREDSRRYVDELRSAGASSVATSVHDCVRQLESQRPVVTAQKSARLSFAVTSK